GERGDCAVRHRWWLDFLQGIVGDTRCLADRYVMAVPVAEAAAAALDAHAAALAAVEVGALCHGDLKAAHIFVEAGRLTGVIDWGGRGGRRPALGHRALRASCGCGVGRLAARGV